MPPLLIAVAGFCNLLAAVAWLAYVEETKRQPHPPYVTERHFWAHREIPNNDGPWFRP